MLGDRETVIVAERPWQRDRVATWRRDREQRDRGRE